MEGLKIKLFTLIEVMAAMAVIVIIAGFGVKVMVWSRISSSETATVSMMQHTAHFLELFKEKKGYYPQYISSDNQVIDPECDSKNGDLVITVDDQLSPNYLSKSELVQMFENYSELVERGYVLEESNAVTLLDGFGRPLQYRCPGRHNLNSYDLFSAGNDGFYKFDEDDRFYDTELEAGNTDNIKNWK